MRIFGHEIAQITAGLEWLTANHFSPPENLKYASDKTLETMCKDIESNINLIKLLSQNAYMLVSIPKVEKTRFYAFTELLYKWGAMFRLAANRKNLIFEIQQTNSNDILRPQINADAKLLEQVVYNLVSNAIKYAYRGTKIHIDCKKTSSNPNSPHILTVTNYGPPIENEDRNKIYDLYYRSEKTQKQAQGLGVGVGLYIVKQIAEAHGGRLGHLCKKVSDVNVPLIYSYINRNFEGKDLDVVKKLESQLVTLKNKGIFDRISAFSYDKTTDSQYQNALQQLQTILKQFKVPKKELIGNILQPTYKVIFYVIIP